MPDGAVPQPECLRGIDLSSRYASSCARQRSMYSCSADAGIILREPLLSDRSCRSTNLALHQVVADAQTLLSLGDGQQHGPAIFHASTTSDLDVVEAPVTGPTLFTRYESAGLVVGPSRRRAVRWFEGPTHQYGLQTGPGGRVGGSGRGGWPTAGLQGPGLTTGLQLPTGSTRWAARGPHEGGQPCIPVGSAGGQSTPIRTRCRNTDVRSSLIWCSRSPFSTDVRSSAAILPTSNLASREKTQGCTLPSGIIARTPLAHWPQSSSSV